MSIKRKLGDVCRILFLAASVTAISVATASPQELGELNARILQDPQNIDLNLRYARVAEDQGKLRLALAAYERVLINNPENVEAQHGYERIRRAIEPAYTIRRIEFGSRWDSNPTNVADAEDDEYSAFARASMIDERRIGSKRWRTIANIEAESHPHNEQLDYGYAGAQTGPLFYLAPHLAAIPSVGVAVSTLDDDYYFGEVNASVTVEGRKDDMSYWARGRAGWRDYGDDATAEEGPYAEVSAGVTIPEVLAPTDSIVIIPRARWSGIDGSVYNFLNEQITPGRYTEVGFDANYYYRVNDNLVLSAGVSVDDRYYDDTEVNGEDRHDTSVEPEVGVSLQNLLPCNCAINVTYSHRDNDSNDPFSDYDGDQVSVSMFAQF